MHAAKPMRQDRDNLPPAIGGRHPGMAESVMTWQGGAPSAVKQGVLTFVFLQKGPKFCVESWRFVN